MASRLKLFTNMLETYITRDTFNVSKKKILFNARAVKILLTSAVFFSKFSMLIIAIIIINESVGISILTWFFVQINVGNFF